MVNIHEDSHHTANDERPPKRKCSPSHLTIYDTSYVDIIVDRELTVNTREDRRRGISGFLAQIRGFDAV
jgi:hypothetical protein